MPRLLLFLLLGLSLVVAACGDDNEETVGTSGEPAATATAAADECSPDALELKTDGTLTVGTDKPAYPPYFEDDDPANGKGFESAVTYAIAEQLGIEEVKWTVVPFNASFAPGPKDFDFDINQISITPKRASFSSATVVAPAYSEPSGTSTAWGVV